MNRDQAETDYWQSMANSLRKELAEVRAELEALKKEVQHDS